MPYSHKKTGKNEITVYKKGSGEVVGHTTPEKYDDYMAALHIHSNDQAARGGIVTPYPEMEQEKEEEGTKGSTDEANDPEFEPMPHLAEGDIVAPSDENELFTLTGQEPAPSGGFLNALKNAPANFAANLMGGKAPGFGLAGNIASAISSPATAAEPPPVPAPAAPRPAVAAAPNALTAKAGNPRPLPGMPADVTPDELQSYLNQQRGMLGKYNPDQQYSQEQAMLKARTGLGGALSGAGATFADAIMQGVARAGSGGFAQQQEERARNVAETAAGATERARKGTLEQMEAGQKIDAQDPKSPLSKAYQQAFAPIFTKMGYDPKSVMAMPASQLGNLADLGVRYADAQTQLELKKAMLQVQTLTAEAGIMNQQLQRQFENKKLGIEHPVASGIQKLMSGLGGNVASQSAPDHAAAIQWAKQNPNDPRAAEIMKRAGGSQ